LWTWIGGSNQQRQVGVYGTLGLAAPANIAGARTGAATWVDGAGNFWLFGGDAFVSADPSYPGIINDLWKYVPPGPQESPTHQVHREDFLVTRLFYRVTLVCLISLLPIAAPARPAVEPNETSLRAADAEELRIILAGDAHAEQAFMHPNYIVNSPANRIVRKDQLIKMLSEGQIASEAIERTIEDTAITGNVGIVMGREIVRPKPNSELGRLHGEKSLERRFTDVFLFEKGDWRLLARQSTVIHAAP
jgi:uncharacterized protein DUF4440